MFPSIQTLHSVIWSQIHFTQQFLPALFLNGTQNVLKVRLPEIIHVCLNPHVCQTRPALKHPAFSITGRKRGKGSDHYTNSLLFSLQGTVCLVHTHTRACVCVPTPRTDFLLRISIGTELRVESEDISCLSPTVPPSICSHLALCSAETKGSKLACPPCMFNRNTAGFGAM